MQVAAGTGQGFQAQNIWSETESRYFDLEVWPELSLGHVKCVNAVFIPSRKTAHQQRILSAAGVFAAFSTNPFGRKPVVHIDPAGKEQTVKLNEFLHEGNPEFQEYCRNVTELGHGKMDLALIDGQELVLESSREVSPGNIQGLFHIVRIPFLDWAGSGNSLGGESKAQEVDLLLKESNHRIKNSISLAASLLQIQASELKSDKAKAALSDSVNRMHTIAQLHESIYRQLQDDKTLDVKPYLEDVLDRLHKSASSHKIIFKTDIEAHNLPTGIAGTLGMLVNEIVQNSLKHAFKETGKGLIGVSFYRIENMYYLSAEDNGGGNPDSKSWKDSDSLGTSLIEEFVSQLGGKLRLERQTGTRYLITFHAPNE
jgi:two-component sensor histidine kinase